MVISAALSKEEGMEEKGRAAMEQGGRNKILKKGGRAESREYSLGYYLEVGRF